MVEDIGRASKCTERSSAWLVIKKCNPLVSRHFLPTSVVMTETLPSSVKSDPLQVIFFFFPLLRLCGSHCSEGDTICLGFRSPFVPCVGHRVDSAPGHFSPRSREVSLLRVAVLPSLHVSVFPSSVLVTWTVGFPDCFPNSLMFSHLFPSLFALLPLKILHFLIRLLSFSFLLWCYLSGDSLACKSFLLAASPFFLFFIF